jgi:hypothetical protein
MVGVLVLASASSMSACIIPVAPDFQDPLPDPPAPAPALSGFQPLDSGSTVIIASTTQGTAFAATVIDPNLGDKLFGRWTVDYPPYTSATLVLPTTTPQLMSSGQATVQQNISCSINNVLAPTAGSEHRLQLLVGNQDFVANSCSNSNPNCLDEIEGGGPVARANWTIVMSSCPQ